MAEIKQVVVLIMENRSFDQYFGTFPGVRGIFDSSPAIPQPWPSQPGGILYPFRASTFTMKGLLGPTLGHDWNTMHAAANVAADGSADNRGFSNSSGSVTSMCYYTQNDIPYHWALARTFALCDNYFCSALAGTGTNRMYLAAGTIDPQPTLANNVYILSPETTEWLLNEPPANGSMPPPVSEQGPIIGNFGVLTNLTVDLQNPQTMVPATAWTQVPWGSYLTNLNAVQDDNDRSRRVSYGVYDDWNWMPPWTTNGFDLWTTVSSRGFVCNDLNIFSCYPDGLGVRGDPFYKESISSSYYNPDAPLQFEIDAANGQLPTVSWVVPPFCASEWPPFTTADGAYYMSRIVDAVINSPQWESTVLIITYDETNAHFDHVVPPLSPNPQQTGVPTFAYEPWVSDPGGTNDNPYPNNPYPNPISSGAYSSSTGVVTLTMSTNVAAFQLNAGDAIFVSLPRGSGTGAYLNLGGTFTCLSASGTTVTYNAGAGQGAATITSGSVIPQNLPTTTSQLAAELAAEPALPIGAGMRVPMIIVSPWTYGAGIISDQMDHTSVLQLMESVTRVQCSGLPPQSATPPNLGWRRATFANLYDVIQNLSTAPATAIDRSQASGVPQQDAALAWQTNGWSRYNAKPTLPAVAPPANWSQMWPPPVQSCAASASNFTSQEVSAAIGANGTATLSNRFLVTVYGFEPDEFINANAGYPPGVPQNPSPPKVNANPISSTSPSVSVQQPTRIPAVVSVSGLNTANEITFNCSCLNLDPGLLAPTAQAGVAQTIEFYFDVTFNTPNTTFAFRNGTSRILEVQVAFTVDTTVTSTVNVYLTGGTITVAPSDGCAQLAEQIWHAELAVLAAKDASWTDAYAGNLAEAERALGMLQNEYAMYCGPGGSGVPPAPGGSSGSPGLSGLGPGSIVQLPSSGFNAPSGGLEPNDGS
jgi:phospholipase C